MIRQIVQYGLITISFTTKTVGRQYVRLIGEDWVHMPDGKRLTHIPFLPLAPYSNQDETKEQILPATMHHGTIALQTNPGGL
jgi:hypothetical protein